MNPAGAVPAGDSESARASSHGAALAQALRHLVGTADADCREVGLLRLAFADLPDAEMVAELYRRVLGRDAAQEEVRDWTVEMAHGGSILDVAGALAESVEAYELPSEHGALVRQQTAMWCALVAVVELGVVDVPVTRTVRGCGAARHGLFVLALFQSALGRDATDEERLECEARLAAGVGRAETIARFATRRDVAERVLGRPAGAVARRVRHRRIVASLRSAVEAAERAELDTLGREWAPYQDVVARAYAAIPVGTV